MSSRLQVKPGDYNFLTSAKKLLTELTSQEEIKELTNIIEIETTKKIIGGILSKIPLLLKPDEYDSYILKIENEIKTLEENIKENKKELGSSKRINNFLNDEIINDEIKLDKLNEELDKNYKRIEKFEKLQNEFNNLNLAKDNGEIYLLFIIDNIVKKIIDPTNIMFLYSYAKFIYDFMINLSQINIELYVFIKKRLFSICLHEALLINDNDDEIKFKSKRFLLFIISLYDLNDPYTGIKWTAEERNEYKKLNEMLDESISTNEEIEINNKKQILENKIKRNVIIKEDEIFDMLKLYLGFAPPNLEFIFLIFNNIGYQLNKYYTSETKKAQAFNTLINNIFNAGAELTDNRMKFKFMEFSENIKKYRK